MTRDRARKRAARQRSALTGERYVVAQRATAQPATARPETAERQPHDDGRLHAFTHRVPGVPAHVDGGLQANAPRSRNSRSGLRHHPRHHEPRVLVAWQNWIAGLLGDGSR